MSRPRPVVLIILDGWGVAPPSRGNAIALAKTPNLNRYVRTYRSVTLQAAGEAVGALWGEMGNSEIGHLNIGSGRIVYQDIQRINNTIRDGSFFRNPVFMKVMEEVKKNGGTLHIAGLVSSGHVHASLEHFIAVVECARRRGVVRVACHLFLDGRDAPYASGLGSVEALSRSLREGGLGEIASVSGRWWAMDRDNHWDRTREVYRAMVQGESAHTATDVAEAIRQSYENHVFDEEFPPTVVLKGGKPVAPMRENDAIIITNFRSDRARQITQALSLPSFIKFDRSKHPRTLTVATMTQYDAHLPVLVAFPPQEITHCLAEVISEHGLRQLHIAETEKYAHITYFLNGGREDPFPGEQNILIPSPSIPSYDMQPGMSAAEIKDEVIAAITARTYDVIMINFANADMVAHTGNLNATIEAVEILDLMLWELVDVTIKDGGVAVITSDHGNAEGLLKPQTGEIDKEHSAEPVPCIIAGKGHEHKGLKDLNDLSTLKPAGVLADVAPTILSLLELPQPVEMIGRAIN
ncbi:MAG: 2,3-bisphosphoglycerate-independent phosphoglycerate mutase [Patescibacteria group bacterium]